MLAAVVVAVSACSGSSSADPGPLVTTTSPSTTAVTESVPSTTVAPPTSAPTTTPPTTAPAATTTSTVPPEEAAAREAAEMFVPAADAAWGVDPAGLPNPEHPDLHRWVAPPVRDNYERTLRTAAELGRYAAGETHFRILGDVVAQEDGSYWAALCMFEDAAVFEADGTVQSPPSTEPRLFRLVLVETEVGWATSEFIRIDGETCEL